MKPEDSSLTGGEDGSYCESPVGKMLDESPVVELEVMKEPLSVKENNKGPDSSKDLTDNHSCCASSENFDHESGEEGLFSSSQSVISEISSINGEVFLASEPNSVPDSPASVDLERVLILAS